MTIFFILINYYKDMKKSFLVITFVSIFLIVDSFYVDISTPYQEEEMRFVYISYLEYLSNFRGNSVKINQSKIDKMIDNIAFYKFNTIFLQVSPFSDAIYNSKLFPYSYTLTGVEGKNPGFDYLEYFIKKARRQKIKVHAWINPYRISSQGNIETVSLNNPAKKYINTENIGVSNGGIYYDPTSEEVKQLLEKQVVELIKNYDIAGIHFDDYFYMDNSIDKVEYENYLKNGHKISLADFRLMHTNDLIERIGTLIKKVKSNIIFSIAPDGNLNNNYQYHYADVKTWIEKEYIDIIIPQLYYGFENQYLPFEKAYNSWNEIIEKTNSKVKLIPALAFYKVGSVDNEAGSGKNEWLAGGIIEKQVLSLREKTNYSGFGVFRYDFLFNKDAVNKMSQKELTNIRNLCK